MKRGLLVVVGLIATVAIAVTAQSVYAAYTGPTSAFPAGNPPAPLDTGSVFQYKNQGIGFLNSATKALEFLSQQTLNVVVGANSVPFLLPFNSLDRKTTLRPGSGGFVIGTDIDSSPTQPGKLCFSDGTCASSWSGITANGDSLWKLDAGKGITYASSTAPNVTMGEFGAGTTVDVNGSLNVNQLPTDSHTGFQYIRTDLKTEGPSASYASPTFAVFQTTWPSVFGGKTWDAIKITSARSNSTCNDASLTVGECAGSAYEAIATAPETVYELSRSAEDLGGGNVNYYLVYREFKKQTVAANGGNLSVSGQICLKGDCIDVWPRGGSGGPSQWSDGSNGTIYYNSGNVGIGTNAPTSPLHVQGGSGSTGLHLSVTPSGTSGNWNSPMVMWDSTGYTGTPSVSDIYWMRQEGNSWTFNTSNADFSNLKNIMTVTNAGNIGIGYGDPAGLLHLYKGDGPATMVMAARGGNWWWASTNDDSSKFLIGATGAARPADANFPLAISGGKIGIGTIDPVAKLAVNNPATAGEGGSSGDALYAFANSGNAAVSAKQANTSGYAIYASGKAAFMNGNVGINDNNPASALSVRGNVVLRSAEGGGMVPGPMLTFETADIGGAFLLSWSATDFTRDAGITTDAAANSADSCDGGGLLEYTSCEVAKGPRSCTDVARLGGAAGYYKRTVTCTRGELGKWGVSMRASNRKLEILDSEGYQVLRASAGSITIPATIRLYEWNAPNLSLPADGTVLTSDGTGGTRWATPAAVPQAETYWTASGVNISNSNNGDVGIGISSPTAKLDVNGTIAIRGGSPGDGKVLTSDANGLASWKTPDAQRNKLCSAIMDTGDVWRDTIVVPNTWTRDLCLRHARAISGYNSHMRAQVGCFSTVSVDAPVSWGTAELAYYSVPGLPSDNNCGWQ
jgi:hypothetical protein